MRCHRCGLLAVAAVTLFVTLLAYEPVMANAARELQPLSTGRLEAKFVEPARAVVIPGAGPAGTDPQARAGLRNSSSHINVNGSSVQLTIDGAYAWNPHAAQSFADFLASLAHGGEMNSLRVLITTPAGLGSNCAGWQSACYWPDTQTMVVPGEEVPGLAPRELLIAHEYGHHIARNRRNDPWPAIDWGTKRWATYEAICAGVHAGAYFPGNESAYYWENPGEAFAQAYAFMRFPNVVPWWWHLAEPDAGSFEAIRADVTNPWSGNTLVRWKGRIKRRPITRSFELPLDGQVQIVVDGPRGADFALSVRSPDGRMLARSRGSEAQKRASFDACGNRSATVHIRRKSGGGRFKLRLSRP
jgi:hypothetical protein